MCGYHYHHFVGGNKRQHRLDVNAMEFVPKAESADSGNGSGSSSEEENSGSEGKLNLSQRQLLCTSTHGSIIDLKRINIDYATPTDQSKLNQRLEVPYFYENFTSTYNVGHNDTTSLQQEEMQVLNVNAQEYVPFHLIPPKSSSSKGEYVIDGETTSEERFFDCLTCTQCKTFMHPNSNGK